MATFEATLPALTGVLKIQGPQHSGDDTCRVAAWYSQSADFSAGALLNADQLDALIYALRAVRHVMVRK